MAILNAALGRARPAPERDLGQMSVIEHLQVLRRVLAVSFLAWGLATVVSFLVWGRVLEVLLARGGLHTLYFHTPTGAFTLALKISLYVGFVIAAPVIIQQAWSFVKPGLHRHEQRLVLPLMLATVVFFAVGVAFAMITLPIFLKVLTGFAPANLHYLPFVDEYVSFVLILIIGFGIVFELPVVLYALGRIGIISSSWLYRNRLYWMIGLGILSALATPGADPVTPVFMFVPLYSFWEGTALLLKLGGR